MKALAAYGKIRDLILSGEKLPGSRLVLADLEKELHIGRGPIREALMRLDKSGLVKNVPYRGAIVAPPPRQREIEYIYKLRAELEVTLAIEAMNHLTDEDFAELDAILVEMDNLKTINEGFYKLDREFHSRILVCAKLPHLYTIVENFLDFIEVFLNLYQYEESTCSIFIEEHKVIVKALQEKDVETLSTVLESNIKGGLDLIKKAYRRIKQ